MKLNPGEVYEEGDPFIFESKEMRDIFYHPPDRTNCPIIFDSLKAEDRFYHPERYHADTSPPDDDTLSIPALSDGVMELLPQKIVEAEVLPSVSPPIGLAPSISYGAIQVNGGVHFHQEQAKAKQNEPPPASEPQQQLAPKPMDMAEKLMGMERFSLYERELYVYMRDKGIHTLIDRDDAKGIITSRLREDLRVRGTANQIRDVYEFLRLDQRLKVATAPPKHLLAFTNGVLNLRTGKFTPGYDPDAFLTWRLEIPFQPEARNCPRFKAVLQHISGGEPEFIARALEVVGYLLIPSSFNKGIVLFQGLSGAGKSVVARLIASFFDPSIVAHLAAAQFENRFAPATLQGCRLNSSMDLPGGKIDADAVGMLKQISGGDSVFLESKGVNGHSGHLDCRFLFGTNHAFVPAVQDDAFVGRIVLLPFRFAVPPEMDDPDLDQKLLSERSAIFNLALEAFQRLQRNHFQFTGEDRYGIRVAGLGNQQADPLVAAFVRDCCVLDPNGQIPTSTLFAAYEAFLTHRGQTFPGNSQQFSRRFHDVAPASVSIKKVRVNGTPTNCYVGISLKGEFYEKL